MTKKIMTESERKKYTRPKDVSRYSLKQRIRLGIKPDFLTDIGIQRKSKPIEEKIISGSSRTRGKNIAGKYVGSGTDGIEKAKIERDDARRELLKDKELIKKYGKDAMKAKSFNTVRDYAKLAKAKKPLKKYKVRDKDY